jgi:hypothetical protein
MRKALLLFVLVFALGATATGSFAQGIFPGVYRHYPPRPTPSRMSLDRLNAALSFTEIPMWTYTVTAGADLGGGTYSGTIIGRSPFLRGKTTTTIPLQIVPVKVIINNGGGDTQTYDPEVNDGCEPAGHTAVDIVQNSPVFTNTSWTMDGVNVGTTQYLDADYRASFWSLVQGTAYHLVQNVSVLPEQTVYFGSVGNAGSTSGPGTNYNAATDFGGCGFVGVVNVNDLVNEVNSLLASLAPTVNIGTLPMILVDSVVSAESGDSIFFECCVLGFHSGFNVGPNLQVTSIFDFDYNGLFGNSDVDTISHELGEAIFDPTGSNPTPVWGNIGQDVGNCPGGQNNLEVGDPLSEGFGTPSNQWVVTGSNGLTYHLQELALFNWFYGGTNLGIPGHYSNHGTFLGDAILCSLGGGTNP